MKKLAVYCGAKEGGNPVYKEAAQNFGSLMAKNGYELIYGGGGTGLMGILSDTFLEEGGSACGYTTDLLYNIEKHNKNLKELHIVETMYIRKEKMALEADGFVILPGGFGTMDEFFDIFVGRQLGIHHKPIFLLNIENYWSPLKDLVQKMIDEKFSPKEHLSYLHIFDTPFELMDYIETRFAFSHDKE